MKKDVDLESLVKIKDYGSIHLKVKERIEEHGINRHILAKAIDVQYDIITRWFHDDLTTKLDMDILAKLCCYFQCPIEDIIEYRKFEPQKPSLPTEIERP